MKINNGFFRKITSAILSFVMMLAFVPASMTAMAEDNAWKDYMAFISPESAYVNFYGELEGRNMSFIDGISQNITDTNNPLYFELVTLDGLEARKQYNANTTYINVDSSFYSSSDREFLVSIVYYDFGPEEGNYKLEYRNSTGTIKQYDFYKPGTNPGWKVHTAIITDADLSKKYGNGASFRIQNNAYNAWRRVEILNLSQLKRDNKVPTITALDITKRRDLEKSGIITVGDTRFTQENLANKCTSYDALTLANNIAMKNTPVDESEKLKTITQAQLIKIFMDAIGVSYSGQSNIISYATSIGFIKADSFFLFDDAPANYFNLGSILDDVLYYEKTSGNPYIFEMFDSEYFGSLGFSEIENPLFKASFYTKERVNPYKVITDTVTGVTYKYVDFFGTILYRPYLTEQNWTRDGKSFVCVATDDVTRTNYLYIYNTETQVIKQLDTVNYYSNVVMGDNDYVYFVKTNPSTGVYGFYRKYVYGDSTTEHLYDFAKGVTPSLPHITNDCKYASFEVGSGASTVAFPRPNKTTPIARLNIEEKKIDYTYYSYNYSNIVNHIQVNPVYPNLVFFAHETDTSQYNYRNMLERSSIMNIETDEVTPISQGLQNTNSGYSMLFFTHESWSVNGDYLYITNLGGDGSSTTPINGVIRVNKDGTHRRYFFNPLINSRGYGSNHSFPSGDDRYFALDNSWAYIMSAETNQVFPICKTAFQIKGHPYHPHPVIARHKYVVDWGMEIDNVLGMAWYDFTHIDSTELAEGGRFKLGDDVEYVRYHEKRAGYPVMDCDITETSIGGKECLLAPNGTRIYFDIDEKIVDAVDESVKITFDYYDNSTNPLVLTYTKGVKNSNDQCRFDNMSTQFALTNSNTWKTASFVIGSGNFEDIGTYGTDFNFKGTNSSIYITNVKVEHMDPSISNVDVDFKAIDKSATEHTFEGIITKKNSTINNATLVAAIYDNEGKVASMKKQSVVFGKDSMTDFGMTIPVKGEDTKIKFFVWNNLTGLRPINKPMEVSDVTVNAREVANGVKLTWDAVEGASSYDVYKDGKYLATTTTPAYNDKYFTAIEQLQNDYMNIYTTPHNYVIKCGSRVSNTVRACADPSLMHYIDFEGLKTTGYQVADNYGTKFYNARVETVANLNAKSHGITINTRIPDSNITDLKPSSSSADTAPSTGAEKIREGYDYYFYNSGKTGTYKSRFLAQKAWNSFYATEKGLSLVYASGMSHDAMKSLLATDPQAGATALTAITETSDKGYYAAPSNPFATVDSFGDTKAEEYVVVMNANMAVSDGGSIFNVCKEVPVNTGDDATDTSWYKAAIGVPYANGTSETIDVMQYGTGRKAANSYCPAANNKFNVPGSLVGKFYTYVFNIDAYFGDTLVNTWVDKVWSSGEDYNANIRFNANVNNEETATIKNIGFVRADDYIK